jgi:DNA polymerase-3 subunit chi
MAEIGFYHLTRSSVADALARLLDRAVQGGRRAVVRCPDAERVGAIDAALWDTAIPEWLPHGTEADGDADLQPIWITTLDESPNGARFLFLVQGAESDRLDAYDRVFDLFDGSDDAVVQAARQRWTRARDAGHALTYWRQGPRGWEKDA